MPLDSEDFKMIKKQFERVATHLSLSREVAMKQAEHLERISANLELMAMSAMAQSGLYDASWDENFQLQLAPRPTPVTTTAFSEVHGFTEKEPVVQKSSGGPVGWVSRAPAPHSAIAIACWPDATQTLGIRCHAEIKQIDGTTAVAPIHFQTE